MKNLKSFNESNREFYEKIDISWKDIEVIKSSPYKNTVYECVFTDSEISLRPISLMSFSVIASKFNRIHTSYPLSSEYRGIGLGYKCYKSVINEVGYVSSDEEGTNIYSRNVWKHLIKDKDYYSFEIKKACDYIKILHEEKMS